MSIVTPRFTTTSISGVSVLLLFGAVAACTLQQASTPATGNDGGSAPPTGSSDAGPSANEPPPPGVTCLQVLQCIIDCPDSDKACPDACVEKGSSEAQSNVAAFARCVETNACTDATCTEEHCSTEIEACVASSKPKSSGTALEGAPPAGSVPADLVGSWAGANSGATERLVFNADGTGNWQSAVASSRPACFSFTRTTRSGTFVVTDTTITLYATSVVTNVQNCKPPQRDTEEPPVTEAITWERKDANTIAIVDSACAAKYAGYEYSIGQYCTSRLMRE
jgi:hypothetical protein